MDTPILPETFGILSISDQRRFEVENDSVTVNDNVQVVCISLYVYTYFSAINMFCPF